MPRITRVTTKTGDAGDTSLATGRRVRKDDPRIEAFGTVDELSACVGLALAAGVEGDLAGALVEIQNDLFHLGAELATPADAAAPGAGPQAGPDTGPASAAGEAPAPGPRIEERHVTRLEDWQERWLDELPPLSNFVLPGGSPGAAALHLARTVCRRAERRLITLAVAEPVPPRAIVYLNRLSDVLFTMARVENRRRGVEPPVWDSRR